MRLEFRRYPGGSEFRRCYSMRLKKVRKKVEIRERSRDSNPGVAEVKRL